MNTFDIITAEPPEGATSIGEWNLNRGQARHFKGTRRDTAKGMDGKPVLVGIEGDQDRDGTVERYIVVNGNVFMDAAEARKHAADILALADEMDAAEEDAAEEMEASDLSLRSNQDCPGGRFCSVSAGQFVYPVDLLRWPFLLSRRSRSVYP
jgi:hypothetical protein